MANSSKETNKDASPNKEASPARDSKQQESRHPEQSNSNERSLAPYRNREPMARVRDEFDRMLDRFTRGWLGIPASAWESHWGVDVREDDNSVTVLAEAPGFEPSEFDIQLRGEQLVMRATHQSDGGDKDNREWRRSEFYQTIPLTSGLETDKIKANYRNGVLTVTVPKSESHKPKRIAVEG
ncbi:MAG TPA: Hsp20/alpha crystallin family protein [Urbifossiella sp.]|nr:Hsp20/alpha crystallin family protein [Urbifossiella sp.]